jgi:hypothetical protein
VPRPLRRVVVDSDVLIQVLRGDAAIAAALERHLASGLPMAVSPITVAEILAGVGQHEEARTRIFLGAFDCLRIDRGVGELCGQFVRRHARTHGLELADALVAACVAANGARLWTLNRRHYPMKELRFFTP